MARLFGFISNRAELGPALVAASAPILNPSCELGKPVGWGVGFYQFGEVLLRRRPLDERAVIDVGAFTKNLKTDIAIGHVRQPTVGNLRTENTHPFRYRQWLFAQTGTLPVSEESRQALIGEQPAFIRLNVRGDTDSELFFYSILSQLHAMGQLEAAHTELAPIQEAVRHTIGQFGELSASSQQTEHVGDALLTNGEYLVAIHRSGNMALHVLTDPERIGTLLDSAGSDTGRKRNVTQAQCCLVASQLAELPPDWQRVPANSLVVLSRTEPARFETI